MPCALLLFNLIKKLANFSKLYGNVSQNIVLEQQHQHDLGIVRSTNSQAPSLMY